MKITLVSIKKLIRYSFFILIIILIFQMTKSPKLVIESAKSGLYSWFNILLPSLFPFMVLSDILISLDYVHLFSKALEPLIKPLYNVSGYGSLPIIISSVSGYPMGAKLTSQIRSNNMVSLIEANRLIAFTSTSGPLYILGTVAIGMLNNSEINFLLIFPHYFAAFTLGLIFRFIKIGDINKFEKKLVKVPNSNKDQLQRKFKPLGKLISDSIKNGISSILLIGGFVIFYSVIINIIFELEVTKTALSFISNFLRLDKEIIKAFFSGIVEMTQGCINIANLSINFYIKILMLNFIIAWGGLSIHSQALSFIYETDINPSIYILAKLAHGILSVFYTIIIYPFKYKHYSLPSISIPIKIIQHINLKNFINILILSLQFTFHTLLCFIVFSIIYSIFCPKNKEA